jgi:peptidoglycan/LPS O-acetylase OafA/YrhL
MSKSSLALSNLRAVVILIVLAFHASLAYVQSAPAPERFDQPPFTWDAFPIVDTHRWLGFDMFCAWQDVSLMALMFFLSGLFVGPSLVRKGAGTYTWDRFKRICLPFIFALVVLSPLALYPAYAMRTPDASLAGYVSALFSLPYWPAGPQWFLWQLMAINGIAALLYTVSPNVVRDLHRAGAWAGEHPVLYYIALSLICVAGYAPLAMGYSPFAWGEFGPFSLQFCRPLLYIVVFFAGFALGSYGLDRGLLATDGPLGRHWCAWTALAVVTFCIWAGLTSLTFPNWDTAPFAAQVGASLAYPPACIAGGTFMLAVFLRFSRTRTRVLDSLSKNAYGIYLVHYVFIVWLQYALLPAGLPPFAKAALVFVGTFVFSWPASIVVTKILSSSFALTAKRPIWTPSR